MIINNIINLINMIILFYNIITITTFIINNNISNLLTSFKYQQYDSIVLYDVTM